MLRLGSTGCGMAETVEDRDAACRLRFKVFNIELGRGVGELVRDGIGQRRFDLFCEHLLVEDKGSGKIVGTYRMQSGASAARNLGYYSEQEFNLAPYEPLRAGILELGRASIDREHRTPEVLTLLWRGIAQYATDMGLRTLIGCSSLNSKDPRRAGRCIASLSNTGFRRSLRRRRPRTMPAPASRKANGAQPPDRPRRCELLRMLR